MKKEIADKWNAALLSGDYPQTTGTLETDGSDEDLGKVPVGFCCLGVLCHIAEKEGIVIRTVDEYGSIQYGTEGDMCAGELPDAVRDWAGMNSTDGRRDNTAYYSDELDRPEYRPTLMALNDSHRLEFAEIAGVIAAEYETL